MGTSYTPPHSAQLEYESRRENRDNTEIIERVWYDPATGTYHYEFRYLDPSGNVIERERGTGDEDDVTNTQEAFRDAVADHR